MEYHGASSEGLEEEVAIVLLGGSMLDALILKVNMEPEKKGCSRDRKEWALCVL